MFEVNRTKNRRILFVLVVGMLVWAGVLLQVRENPAFSSEIVPDQRLSVPGMQLNGFRVCQSRCMGSDGGLKSCHRALQMYPCGGEPHTHYGCRSTCQ
jgi:hypothetical protein